MKSNRRTPGARAAAVLFLLPTTGIASGETYRYDSAGRLTGISYDSGEVVLYSYDRSGNLLGRSVVTDATEADLAISKTASISSVGSGMEFTYTITVTNAGPDLATRVTVSDDLPVGIVASEFQTSQGHCTLSGRSLLCHLGVVGVGESTVVELKAFHAIEGSWVNEATVDSDQNDPNSANNSSSVSTTGLVAEDSDGDGMPDWWEVEYGLNPGDASLADGPDGDPDKDHYSNYEEWLADTDPRDRESGLKILAVKPGDGDALLIYAGTSPNRMYTLERTTDLSTPFVPLYDVAGTGSVIIFQDTPDQQASEKGFYRLRVGLPGP